MYPGARCAINAKAMTWAWGPYSSWMTLPACTSGSSRPAGTGTAGITPTSKGACTQALPVLSLWAKLEPKRCEGPARTTFPHSLGDEGCKC